MKCKEPGCNIEVIWVRTIKGNWMLIDFSSVCDEELILLAQGITLNYKYGVHIPHWSTCKNPNRFRNDTNAKQE